VLAARPVLLIATLLLFAPALAAAGPPPLTDDRLGIRTAPLLLLSRPDVRAELQLDNAQSADAERVLGDLYQQALALKGQHGSEVSNRKRAIDEAGQRWLQTRLSAAQQKRFSQIDLQWEGPAALVHRPIIADALGLTEPQRERLAEAINERDRGRSQGIDLWECERRFFEQTKAMLTADQMRRWRTMLGPPFTFVRQPGQRKPDPPQ
jgi:hypothetical protein